MELIDNLPLVIISHTVNTREERSDKNINQFLPTTAHTFRVSDLKMRYVAAYLLAVLGGNESPSSGDIEKILSSVGIEADGEKLKKVIGELKGKSIEDLIAEGKEKLCSMPVGGGAVAASGPVAAAAPAAVEKKEEKKEEKEESDEDDDMGFGLFD